MTVIVAMAILIGLLGMAVMLLRWQERALVRDCRRLEARLEQLREQLP